MKHISPSDPRLQYMGRIDRQDPDAPDFIWAGSLVQFRFTGSQLVLMIENHACFAGMQLGCIIDGTERQIELGDEDGRYDIPVGGAGTHSFILFKRQDATHHFILHEILLSDGGDLLGSPPLPELKLECYGDSVTAGSAVEMLDRIGQNDPEVYNALDDNAWHSYAMQTARLLGAQVHLVAQGGIALFDGTGWYACGMETAYDKLCYLTWTEQMTDWDFSRYTPDFVTVAIGQNDAHLSEDENRLLTEEERECWLDRYCRMIEDLMRKYPKAVFIVFLTLMMHDPYWETLLDDACARLGSPRVRRFRFTRSGKATPGHPRIPEQCEMACELTEYIRGLMQARS